MILQQGNIQTGWNQEKKCIKRKKKIDKMMIFPPKSMCYGLANAAFLNSEMA